MILAGDHVGPAGLGVLILRMGLGVGDHPVEQQGVQFVVVYGPGMWSDRSSLKRSGSFVQTCRTCS